jgi:hypothetical protein
MTSVEYVTIMHKKVMEKVVAEVIYKETCHKEREESRVRKSTSYFNAYEWHLNVRLLKVQEQILNTINLQQLLRN